MDYTKSMGGAALGARLRRLSDAVDRDATRAYATLGITFEQRWFGVLNQLALNGPMTVSELAATLRITRASVSQTRQSLEEAGIVTTKDHPSDARQRHLVLSRTGTALIRRLRPLWQAMDAAALDVNAAAGDAAAALDRLEAVLTQQSMFDRIVEKLSDNGGNAKFRRAKS
ncbi:MAG TPA: MarR family transcriptional regulator [Tahibacter sp.]|uniref:MarR family winged helix-turn-helix transcriptional regulator n=1 Tax=Tahibacter sp. TaxID=2056211 RepID=UPI002C68673D|nr:MarR family transcriptional regulator [Tahibacter sp.]HSX63024.1 MarR family transcriptional regulator [Tahibacter sp.]